MKEKGPEGKTAVLEKNRKAGQTRQEKPRENACTQLSSERALPPNRFAGALY